MEFPHDFLKFTSGPSPDGQSAKRAMDTVATPYLTNISGNTITRKKNGFTETASTAGEPSLIGYYRAGTEVKMALVDVENNTSINSVKFSTFFKLGSAAAAVTLGRLPYVGDGLVMALFSDANDVGDIAATHWPSLTYTAGAVKQHLAGAPEPVTGKSVSFIEGVQVSGLGATLHHFSTLATGWDDATRRYRFCLSGTSYTNPSDKYNTRAPVFFTGGTGDMTMQQVGFPYYSGRDNPFCSPFVIGPGRLQALQVVTEDTAQTMVPPFLANSVDHGTTWSSADADFLTPFLRIIPADGGTRAKYDELQIAALGAYSINVYVGEGKSMLIIPAGFVDMGGAGGAARYAAMAFLGSDGGGYTRINWPPDSWYVAANGAADGGNEVLLALSHQDKRSAQFSIGPGCMYLVVLHEGVGKFLVTYDFGLTWELKVQPARPEGIAGLLPSSGAVIAPFKSTEDPGQIIFALPDFDAGRIDFLRTDGTFSKFEKTAGRIKAPTLTTGDGAAVGVLNYYFTCFGGTRPPYIFPAFPGEFDKP